MYTLTLTKAEREAFDWVGYRYAAGEISDILRRCEPPDQEWCGPGEITFTIPEGTAWEIDALASDEDYSFPCFGPDLTNKMSDFLGSIV